jgi:hypothetical protein
MAEKLVGKISEFKDGDKGGGQQHGTVGHANHSRLMLGFLPPPAVAEGGRAGANLSQPARGLASRA